MMLTRKHAEWLVILFFAGVIGIVFQQIFTSMTEQGIASGSPYDNAAAYPQAVAILMGVLLVALVAIQRFAAKSSGEKTGIALSTMRRPILLLLIFAAYLWSLGILGYHLSTPPMIMAIMFLSGLRKPVEIVLVGVGVSFVLAFMFEFFLKIVLPGGIFGLNILW